MSATDPNGFLSKKNLSDSDIVNFLNAIYNEALLIEKRGQNIDNSLNKAVLEDLLSLKGICEDILEKLKSGSELSNNDKEGLRGMLLLAKSQIQRSIGKERITSGIDLYLNKLN